MKIAKNIFYGLVLLSGAFFAVVYFGKINFINAFIVESGSMEPVIKTGSVVFSIKQNDYKTNDVVTFKSTADNKTLITHRILFKNTYTEFNPIYYLTSGDANKTIDDGKIDNNQIIGKIFLTIPFLGYLLNNIKTPMGIVFIVVVPATIIVYEELKFLKQELVKLLKKKGVDNNGPTNKASILIPIIGSFMFLTTVTGSYFSSSALSSGNTFSVGREFSNQKDALLYNSNSYTCTDGATDFSQPQLTNVVLKNDGVNISVTVNLTNATPSSTYDIWINQDPGGCPLSSPTSAGAITTDGSGNGTGTSSATLISGANKFWISAVGGGQVLRSTSISF